MLQTEKMKIKFLLFIQIQGYKYNKKPMGERAFDNTFNRYIFTKLVKTIQL